VGDDEREGGDPHEDDKPLYEREHPNEERDRPLAISRSKKLLLFFVLAE